MANLSGKGIAWDEPKVEQLKALWEAGLSASQIAREIGGVTRNSVIGKVHRLGLSGRAKPQRSHVPRPRKARSTSRVARIPRPVLEGNSALAHAYETETTPEPDHFDSAIPMTQRKSLMDLTADTCHWPIGDPGADDFYFCGGKSFGALPYCTHHARISYQATPIRRSYSPRSRI